MRKFSKTIFLVVVLALGYVFRAPLLTELSPMYNSAKSNFQAIFFPRIPCEEPIAYNLGNFDTKFKISKDYFLSALKDAEAVWEKSYDGNGDGKGELFNYEPSNTEDEVMKVNLIYDYRQEATSKLKSIGVVVEDNKATYEKLKDKLDTLKAEYNSASTALNKRVLEFNKEQSAYEAEVESWNKKGGAPQKEYDRLEDERQDLEAESRELQKSQDKVNGMADEINALVTTLNRLISVLNLSVEKYNTTNDARGESFEEGVYISDGYNQEIDIYEFSNRSKLVRVLAHELGHALGLEHLKDPKAIMYEFNQSNTVTLSKTDLDALKTLCGASTESSAEES